MKKFFTHGVKSNSNAISTGTIDPFNRNLIKKNFEARALHSKNRLKINGFAGQYLRLQHIGHFFIHFREYFVDISCSV